MFKRIVSVVVMLFFFTITANSLTSVVQAASFPSLKVEPELIEFGSLEVGSSSPIQTVTITNYVDSTNVLTIFDIYINGPDADNFMIMNDNCSGRILDGSIYSTLEIIFMPTTTGNKNATLMIPSNATAKPYELALSGIGIASNNNQITNSVVNESANTSIIDQISALNGNSPFMSWGWILVILGGTVLVIILLVSTKRFIRK